MDYLFIITLSIVNIYVFNDKDFYTRKLFFYRFYQTKQLFILVPAPISYLTCTNFLQWGRKCTFLEFLVHICVIFGVNLSSQLKKNKNKKTAPSNVAICDEFRNLVSNISTILNAHLALFWCKNVSDLINISLPCLIIKHTNSNYLIFLVL